MRSVGIVLGILAGAGLLLYGTFGSLLQASNPSEAMGYEGLLALAIVGAVLASIYEHFAANEDREQIVGEIRALAAAVRPPVTGPVPCAKCGTVPAPRQAFCSRCGGALRSDGSPVRGPAP